MCVLFDGLWPGIICLFYFWKYLIGLVHFPLKSIPVSVAAGAISADSLWFFIFFYNFHGIAQFCFQNTIFSGESLNFWFKLRYFLYILILIDLIPSIHFIVNFLMHFFILLRFRSNFTNDVGDGQINDVTKVLQV